jgi:hypothetical protein
MLMIFPVHQNLTYLTYSVGSFIKVTRTSDALTTRSFSFVKLLMQKKFGDGVLESLNSVAGMIDYNVLKYIIRNHME